MKTVDDQINDAIDRWHKDNADLPIHEYLGMTIDEYAKWVEQGTVPEGYIVPQFIDTTNPDAKPIRYATDFGGPDGWTLRLDPDKT